MSPPKKKWSWRSQAFRALVYQVVAVAVVEIDNLINHLNNTYDVII